MEHTQDQQTRYTNMPDMLFILLYTWYQVGWTMVLCVHKKDDPRDALPTTPKKGHKRPCSTLEGGCKANTLFRVSIYVLCRVYSSVWLSAFVSETKRRPVRRNGAAFAAPRLPLRLPCVALHSSVRSVCIRCIQIQSIVEHVCSLSLANLHRL